jgi:lysozyme family protein
LQLYHEDHLKPRADRIGDAAVGKYQLDDREGCNTAQGLNAREKVHCFPLTGTASSGAPFFPSQPHSEQVMTDLVALKAANAKRWANAKLTRNFAPVAKSLVAAKPRYQTVEASTGVPWFVTAVIHERESGQNWFCSLAQGDPWNRVSVHVPAGRGPFKSWEDAAIDALVKCAPYAARNKDWSVGGTLTQLEEYNGLGYASRGIPSPYIWSGTDQYVAGKYVRDGVFDSHAVDQQPGCAGLLMAMIALDPSIAFAGVTRSPPFVAAKPPTPLVPKPPSITNPARGSIGAAIASLLSAIFNRKGK